MPMLRPLAALLVAAPAAACAAGGHRVPDEDDRIDVAHRDSLVTGAAISATMPFEGSVYPVPPSHHAPAADPRAASAHGAGHADAAPAGAYAAGDTAHHAVPQAEPAAQPARTGPAAVPNPTAPAPATPAADAGDEHADHTP